MSSMAQLNTTRGGPTMSETWSDHDDWMWMTTVPESEPGVVDPAEDPEPDPEPEPDEWDEPAEEPAEEEDEHRLDPDDALLRHGPFWREVLCPRPEVL